MVDLSQSFKAYDIRGVVPDALNEEVARAVGAAVVRVLDARQLVVAHDMRPSSPPLMRAFVEGATGQGADVLLAGLASTDLLYYATGVLGMPGAMFTASHNPARYNGIKLTRAGAAPIGEDTGLADIRALIEAGIPSHDGPSGTVRPVQLLDDYARHLHGLVDLSGIRPLRVVVDAGNAMAGLTAPPVLGVEPIELVPLYFELDGTFPNHEANPLDLATLQDAQALVRKTGADLGLAFDGDADRCYVIDERGEPVSPSLVTALVASRMLAVEPGATVIYNAIVSHAVPELVGELGGKAVRTRVGHSFIKAEMARTGAIFGGEHSAHYYFRDFWRADTGMLAALHVLAALGQQPQPFSELIGQFARYHMSGELNRAVADQQASLAMVQARFTGRPGIRLDHLDGLTVESAEGWWFNLRPSNTEPLLRLNVEAVSPTMMARVRDEVLERIDQHERSRRAAPAHIQAPGGT